MQSCSLIRHAWIHAAERLHELYTSGLWRELGYDKWADVLAQPEVDLQPPHAFHLMKLYRVFCIDGGMETRELRRVDQRKLALMLPAVESFNRDPQHPQGQSPQRAVADAEHLDRERIRHLYRMRDAAGHLPAPKVECPCCGSRVPRSRIREDEAA